MVKIISPLLSFDASGNLGDRITYSKRHRRNIVERIAQPADAKTQAQLSWRTMFEKCTLLWHSLGVAEKETWERLATPRHMTGYALWQSQCLRPNPGIYLPLAGGNMTGNVTAEPGVTFDGVDLSELPFADYLPLAGGLMAGAIAMGTNKITGLGDPMANQDAVTKAWYLANLPAGGYTQGARVYNNAVQSIPDSAWTAITLNNESYDTDSIHDNVTNNSRLTCKTAGKYLITAHGGMTMGVGKRLILGIRLGGSTWLGINTIWGTVAGPLDLTLTTIYILAVNEYVEFCFHQANGVATNTAVAVAYTPAFMMQRIG